VPAALVGLALASVRGFAVTAWRGWRLPSAEEIPSHMARALVTCRRTSGRP